MNILFLCTGNSCRSIMAEALLNHLGNGQFRAFSAGSAPAKVPNPHALNVLKLKGISVVGLRSKSWNEFTKDNAPIMDIVITVCDDAAGKVCPVWPGGPGTVHWPLPDPYLVKGTLDKKMTTFNKTFDVLEDRVNSILSLGKYNPEVSQFRIALNDLLA